MAAPKIIEELIDKFDSDPAFYKSIHFNETEVRTQFINPFFDALGWDVYHKCRPDNRDVKEEDAVKVEGKTKNPDYSFRLFEKRKFFVEVKKPSINIESGIYPAYQIRSYAWSADLPISILTDFEEFSVYYCHTRPFRDDKPTKQRLLYFRYDQYAEKWPEIAALFSREAVLNGSLDKYVRSLPQKRGDKRVDAALLEDISEWREMLAKNIALHNPERDTMSLNYSVQAIIDRIMFLRICEDRGIEQYMRLKDLLNGERVYPRLCELFRQADERYNSGIFHFKKEPGRDNPDTITLNLNIDDGTLKEIIKHLYFPESPYAFSVLPAEILGQIYEQFLGKVIRLDDSHIAWVEDKPEVKKAGGVKYTPVYIVEAIVSKTLGPMLKGKTPLEVVLITVLDPACGSGSFLIVAYQYLLDWHRDWYVQNLVPLLQSGLKPSSPEIRRLLPGVETGKKGRKKEPELPVYQGRDGEWKLTTAERKRILLNNIYGVDIDRQAVEVTKLSLLLKVLEGENEETISKQLTLFQERALPDLSRNIKCGNSLIGWDILNDNPGLKQEEIDKINPFDWEREFPEIFQRGGFSVVIGNPPWGAEFGSIGLEYLRKKFSRVIDRMIDSYIYFIDQGIKLAAPGQAVGYIIPSTILNQADCKSIREILLERGISFLVNLGQGIFGSDVLNTSTILISVQPSQFSDSNGLLFQDDLSSLPLLHRKDRLANVSPIEWSRWKQLVKEDPQLTFHTGDQKLVILLNRLRGIHPPLAEAVDGKIQRGVSPDVVSSHVVSINEAEKNRLEIEILRPSISGGQIKRYGSWSIDQYIIYTNRDTPIEKYPNIYNYMLRYKDQNTCKEVIQKKHPWYSLHRARNPSIFSVPKFIGLTTTRIIELIYDPTGTIYVTDAMYVFKPIPDQDPFTMMAILHSKLFLFLYKTSNVGESRVIPQVKATKLATLPYPKQSSNLAITKGINEKCKTMLSLHKQLKEARTPHEQTSHQRQIEVTDGQIDALVYELYGLTEEEIKIVEGT